MQLHSESLRHVDFFTPSVQVPHILQVPLSPIESYAEWWNAERDVLNNASLDFVKTVIAAGGANMLSL